MVDRRLILALRQHLSADIVDSRHILSLQAAEIMTETRTRPAVLPVILNHVPDVRHAVRPAPVSNLVTEIVPHKLCQLIHIGIMDSRGLRVGFLAPERRKPSFPVFAEPCRHFFGKIAAPRQVLAAAQEIPFVVQHSVAELRLIGEKAGNRLAEIVCVVCIVRLVDRVNQDSAALLLRHVDIIAVISAVSACDHGKKLPHALRFLKRHRLPVKPAA